MAEHPSEPAGAVASRAEPPASSSIALWVGAAATVLVLGGLALKLGRPSSAHVPSGIAGVKLGNTLEEARRALPELTGELRARAQLFDEPATCTLELAVNDRVSRIECVVDADARARAKLLATLRELYGKESQTRESSWLWKNEQARLLVVATPSLRVTSWSKAHEDARARR